MYIDIKLPKTYIGMAISDIHFGAMDSEELLYELNEKFFKYIKSLKVLDFIIICGDLFDSKISLNSEHAKFAFAFFKKLLDICRKKDTKLRIVKGTESHDNKQLETLKYFSSTDVDFKIITKVKDEWLFPNMKVLYIPEEYMKDKDKYYEKFFSKPDNYYDMIFGHGLFNEVAFVAKNQQSEITMHNAPIFKSTDLLRISKGPIIFGHIHKSQQIKERIYYTGSFSRWMFGEEEPKGFMSLIYTPDTGNYKLDFIKNDLANEYNTITINCNDPNKDISSYVDEIISITENIKSNKLRIIVNIPESFTNPKLLSSLIIDTFAHNKKLKIVINNDSKETKNKKDMEDKVKLLMSMYDFIFDKGIPIEEKLSRFIKIKYSKDISEDSIRDYLYQKLNV